MRIKKKLFNLTFVTLSLLVPSLHLGNIVLDTNSAIYSLAASIYLDKWPF